MKLHRNRPEINASSMADIAFLLLTFFLITTVIDEQQGLPFRLAPWEQAPTQTMVHRRNHFIISLNSAGQFLVQGEVRSAIDGLRGELKRFILNPDHSDSLSESPEKAVITIRSDRDARYQDYVSVLDEAEAAYLELYAARAGLSPAAFRQLNLGKTADRLLYENARAGLPMNINVVP